MGLDIGGALRVGYERCRTPAGLRLIAVAFVIQLAANVASDSAQGAASGTAPDAVPVDAAPLALALPPSVLGLLSTLSFVASLVFTLVAIRTFAADAREAVPAWAYRENVLRPTLTLLAGAVVLGVAVAVGLVLFVVPGLFLLVSLIFFQVYVAAEDEGFVDAMTASWNLAGGSRISLFLTGVAVVVLSVLVTVAFAVVALLVGVVSGFLEGVVDTVGGAVVTTYVLAVVVAAYDQLRAAAADRAPTHGGDASDPTDSDADWS